MGKKGGGGGGGRSGSAVTTVQSSSPLIPEGLQGYLSGEGFLRNVLAQPPVYTGQRVAQQDPLQSTAYNQAGTIFGATSPTLRNSINQLNATTAGDYLNGPAAQAAVGSLAAPIFQQFQDQIIPGIRDSFQAAGQGTTSTRRDIATNEALQTLGRNLATGAVAPIFQSERQNQINAAAAAPGLEQTTEQGRLGSLFGAGASQQAQEQAILDALRQQYEEPLARQFLAGQSLIDAAKGIPLGSTQTAATYPSGLQTAGDVAGLLGNLAIVGKLGKNLFNKGGG